MGVYLIWPAFFTNVTDAFRLGRAGRIRTDLGGVYFNALFALSLTAIYLATGFAPLLAAIVIVHAEIIQQLLPSLRFDGYFILADLIGVPDLFRRILPTLRSMIPGQPVDPRVQGLKRAARVTLTAWVLAVVPLLAIELGLIVLNAPSVATTFARSVVVQVTAGTAQFGQADIPAGLVSVISIVLLVLPMAGLCYVLLLTGRHGLRAVITLNRRHPVLLLPSVAVALALTAALAAHWGLLPANAGRAAPRPSAARVIIRGPARFPAPVAPRHLAPRHLAPQPRSVTLTPLSAAGFDPLSSPGSDPADENSDLAQYAIDQDPATSWSTQYYVGNPVFGGLKAGSGLILDMGRPVRLSSVTVTFGPAPGADVTIEVGNSDALAVSTLRSFTPVATAEGVSGRHSFLAAGSAWGRYVLVWFTKLPPTGLGRFQAQIFGITVRGTAGPR
jgi:putative peptide zinc metalloprotease protein